MAQARCQGLVDDRSSCRGSRSWRDAWGWRSCAEGWGGDNELALVVHEAGSFIGGFLPGIGRC